MKEITLTKAQYALVLKGFPLVPLPENVPDDTLVCFKEEDTGRSLILKTSRCLDCSEFVPGLYLYSYDKEHTTCPVTSSCTCGCSADNRCGDRNCPHCSRRESSMGDLAATLAEQLLAKAMKNGILSQLLENSVTVAPPLLVTGDNIEEVKKQIASTVPFEIAGLEEATTLGEVYDAVNANPNVSLVVAPEARELPKPQSEKRPSKLTLQ